MVLTKTDLFAKYAIFRISVIRICFLFPEP
jgi:hypothetical protein